MQYKYVYLVNENWQALLQNSYKPFSIRIIKDIQNTQNQFEVSEIKTSPQEAELPEWLMMTMMNGYSTLNYNDFKQKHSDNY